MDVETILLELEARFWKGDAEFYRQHLADKALLVFPDPVGQLTREETVAAIDSAARWDTVEFADTRLLLPAAGTAVLAYAASARRQGDSSDYRTLAGSVYVKQDGVWKLAFHQQTPRSQA